MSSLSGWLLAPAPRQRLAAVRVVVGVYSLVYLLLRLPHFLSLANFQRDLFAPVGIMSVLERPLLPITVYILFAATVALALCFTIGYRYRSCAPLFAVALLALLTYRHSWGMIYHTDNLWMIHVLILSLSPGADALAVDSRAAVASSSAHTSPASSWRYGYPLRLMGLAVVITYFLAGYAKLGNPAWIWGDELRNHVAVDNLRKLLLGDIYSPIAGPLLPVDWLFRVLAVATLVIELGAPIALFAARATAVWVVVIVGFHWSVLALMMIAFPYQMSVAAFACLFRAERLVEPLMRRLCRHMRHSRAGLSRS